MLVRSLVRNDGIVTVLFWCVSWHCVRCDAASMFIIFLPQRNPITILPKSASTEPSTHVAIIPVSPRASSRKQWVQCTLFTTSAVSRMLTKHPWQDLVCKSFQKSTWKRHITQKKVTEKEKILRTGNKWGNATDYELKVISNRLTLTYLTWSKCIFITACKRMTAFSSLRFLIFALHQHFNKIS